MSDKYRRTGIRAGDVKELKDFVLDFDKKFINDYKRVLMEGSQGWWLDIDHGFYPYVTSGHMHPAHAFSSFGLPMRMLGTIYGVGKVYETYVGNKSDMVYATPNHVTRLREAGQEYGETTGRPREIGYLNLDRLVEAVSRTGVTHLYLNKMDILEECKIFNVGYTNDKGIRVIKGLGTSSNFKEFVNEYVTRRIRNVIITFSGNKYGI